MDIVLLILLLIGFIVGFKKGFINVFFKIIGMFLAIVLAFATYKMVVKNIIPKTGLQQTIHNYVESNIDKKEENNTSIKLPKIVDSFIDTSVIVNQAKSNIIEKTTNFIINTITILVLIIIYYIIITIIRIILDNIFKLPVLNAFNKIAGAALETVRVLVMVLIIFSSINITATITNVEGVIKFINNSVVSSYLYNHNPIDSFIVVKQRKVIEKEGTEIINEKGN